MALATGAELALAKGAEWGAQASGAASALGPCHMTPHLSDCCESSGGLGALLGSSGEVLGGLWGVSWAMFLALGRSWKGFGSTSVAKAFPGAIFFEFVLRLG